MSKRELVAKNRDVKREIEELNRIVNIGNLESFELIISKIKEDIIEQKEDELEELQYQFDNYQMNMFEKFYDDAEEPKDTGIKHNNKMLRTGDVYKTDGEDEQDSCYFMVVCSKEMSDKFALITNYIEGEHLLQYPKNQELLTGAAYLGNIYFKDDKNAQDGFDKISYFWENVSE